MKIPIIKGVIDRRILVNYQVDKEILENYLPDPFKPKLINGKGMAGICLIRLKEIRPIGLPNRLGISSENAAHRIAVEWFDKGKLREGVFIPRRDTSSKWNSLAGGRVFPGVHHHARFTVDESGGNYDVGFVSKDSTSLSIVAKESNEWEKGSVFEDLQCASDFFERGSVGYSPHGDVFDGLELKAYSWKVSPLVVEKVQSTFFENEKVFPTDSVNFDNALLMKNIEHEWVGLESLEG